MTLARAFCFLLLLLLFTGPAPLSAAEPPAPVAEADGNAAALYQKAFAAMRAFTDEEEAFLNTTIGRYALDTPTPIHFEKATALLADFTPALASYQEATRLPNCDWKLDYSQGPAINFEHLSKLIKITKLTLLQARLHIHRSEPTEALENIRQALITSRQAAGKSPLIIETLVQHAIEMMTTYTLACDLSRWDTPSLQSLAALLDRTPSLPRFAQSIQAERTLFMPWFREQIEKAQKNGSPLPEEIKQLLREKHSLAEAEKGIQQLDEDYAKCASFLQHPFPDSLQRMGSYLEKLSEESNPRIFSSTSIPTLVSVYQRSLETELRLAMLRTAIAIRLKGPEAVKTSSDPLTHRPFLYQNLAEGSAFQLEFELPIQEKTTTLTIR